MAEGERGVDEGPNVERLRRPEDEAPQLGFGEAKGAVDRELVPVAVPDRLGQPRLEVDAEEAGRADRGDVDDELGHRAPKRNPSSERLGIADDEDGEVERCLRVERLRERRHPVEEHVANPASIGAPEERRILRPDRHSGEDPVAGVLVPDLLEGDDVGVGALELLREVGRLFGVVGVEEVFDVVRSDAHRASLSCTLVFMDRALHFVLSEAASLLADHGEVFELPEGDDALFVQPTGEFFPDAFERTPAGVAAFVERMRTYTPLSDDLPLSIAFLSPDDDGGAGGGGCGSGGCSTPGTKEIVRGGVRETDDGYALLVHTQDVGTPELLAASVARGLGLVVLAECEDAFEPATAFARAEVAAGLLGLPVLLAAATSVYTKGCGGMREHRGTTLSMDEAVALLAVYARLSGRSAFAAKRHLPVTQSEAFDEAWRWVKGNDELLQKLREAPELLATGAFVVEEPRGLFGRLLGGRESSART